MNRIDALFANKKNDILSVYFTAGFPQLDDTSLILNELQRSGADMVEIGIPFSDPLADGPVIQESSSKAIENGMTIPVLFSQLKGIRERINIPLVLMGYLNPVMQFGIEKFCAAAMEVGIDGLILPDLPPEIYEQQYKELFHQYGLKNILLVTPSTSDDRIKQLDKLSEGFLYAVSSSATTGGGQVDANKQQVYFQRLKNLGLKNPVMIGFGISNATQFRNACSHASGAIVGSAFIRKIAESKDLSISINEFVAALTGLQG